MVTIMLLVPKAVCAFTPPAVIVALPPILTLNTVAPPALKSNPLLPELASQFTAQ